MTGIERNGAGFVVAATLLAEAFKMTTDEIRHAMRDGTLTSLCEAGEGTDIGRWRLTFRLAGTVCRFTVDESCAILSRSSFPVRLTSRNAP